MMMEQNKYFAPYVLSSSISQKAYETSSSSKSQEKCGSTSKFFIIMIFYFIFIVFFHLPFVGGKERQGRQGQQLGQGR